MQDYRTFVKSDYTYLEPRALLRMPVSILLGVSSDAEDALKLLQIFSVFDLGASRIFANAKRIIEASQESGDLFERYGGVASDIVDKAAHVFEIPELPTQPIEILDGIGSASGSMLTKALHVETIHDLAYWPPYIAAAQLVTSILVPEQLKIYDPEAPADLIPSSGDHPTEKVSYTTVVISEVDGTALEDLDGQVDIADLSQEGTGSSKPATGAIITTEQTWFAQGVALGSLLHSIALAPGESTRIAMVDWTRRTTAQTEEETEQKEDLRNETEHSRSISEVTRAVANETQHGSSVSTSLGLGGNVGFAVGLVALPVGAQGGSAGGAASYGRATMVSTSSGRRNLFADMTQDVSDSTLQIASSVRNRRASIVQEVTQQEKETLTTRAITNYNHMHALSVQYYEIVQIYRVTTRASKVDKCLFIPMKMIENWTIDIVNGYRAIIANVALDKTVGAALGQGAVNLVEIVPLVSTREIDDNRARRLEDQLDNAKLATNMTIAPGIRSPWLLPNETQLLSIDFIGFISGVVIKLYGNKPGPTTQIADPVLPGFHKAWKLASPVRIMDIESITFRIEELPGGPDTAVDFRLNLRYQGVEIAYEIVGKEGGNSVVDNGVGLLEVARFTPQFTSFQLLEHLQLNSAYYNHAIWLNIDTPSLTLLLSKYKYNGIPLLQQIDPIPVAVTGNYLGFRMHVDPAEDEDWRNWLKNHGFYEEDGQSLKNTAVHDTVPLPSGGVFAEAVLGRFNSAEKLDMTRFWNWQDSPIPIVAPEIAALQAGGKTQNISQDTGQLEAPVIYQAAPVPLPDPQGLAAIINAITTSNMFRDMSGSAQAAALAQAAMQAAALAATAAGSQAGQNMETAAKYSLEYMKAVLPLIQSLGGKATSPLNKALSPGGANVSEVGALMNYARRLNQGRNNRAENGDESGTVFAGDYLARTRDGITDYEAEAFKSLFEPDSNFVEAILAAFGSDTNSSTESISNLAPILRSNTNLLQAINQLSPSVIEKVHQMIGTDPSWFLQFLLNSGTTKMEVKQRWLDYIREYLNFREDLRIRNEFTLVSKLHQRIDWVWAVLAEERWFPETKLDDIAKHYLPASEALDTWEEIETASEYHLGFKWLQLAGAIVENYWIKMERLDQFNQRKEAAESSQPSPLWNEIAQEEERLKQYFNSQQQRMRDQIEFQRSLPPGRFSGVDPSDIAQQTEKRLEEWVERRVADYRRLVDSSSGRLNPTTEFGSQLIEILTMMYEKKQYQDNTYLEALEAIKTGPSEAYIFFYNQGLMRISPDSGPEALLNTFRKYDPPLHFLWWTTSHTEVFHPPVGESY